jgi:UDP-GlcNAc:undecaprenyl-phosphate GlcNAc-1-phosphate transferase
MDGITQLAWASAKAFLIAVIGTPIIRDVFRSYNVVDRPGRRKVHRYPIPRVGGMAIALAYGISLISLGNISGSLPDYRSPAWTLIAGAGVVFLVGLLDDFFDLKPVFKIVGVVIAAFIVFWNGIRIDTLVGVEMPLWLSFVVTVGWLLLTTNALNLIDGLDGLCAGMGLLATLTLFGAAVIYGNYPLAHATLPLAGALVGFLCYNFNPATVFLGDSGAMLIGFLLGCYGMFWTQKAATLLSVTVPLLALSIPILDVSLSVLRRFLMNRPIFSADKGHIHHKLLDLGLSPKRAVLLLYLASVLPAGLALVLSAPNLRRYQAYAVIAFCIAVWIGVRRLRYVEFDMAGNLLFGGEFHKAIDARLRLRTLVVALDHTAGEDEWWARIIDLARELNWVRVRLEGDHSAREQVLSEEVAPVWSFRVPLSESESLYAEGYVETGNSKLDLMEFASVLARTYIRNREKWDSVAFH